MDFDATLVPADVVAVLGLADGKFYTAQNVSGTATLYLRESTAAPAVTDRAFRVESGGQFTIRPTGSPIWLWTDDAGGCAVILAEAA